MRYNFRVDYDYAKDTLKWLTVTTTLLVVLTLALFLYFFSSYIDDIKVRNRINTVIDNTKYTFLENYNRQYFYIQQNLNHSLSEYNLYPIYMRRDYYKQKVIEYIKKYPFIKSITIMFNADIFDGLDLHYSQTELYEPTGQFYLHCFNTIDNEIQFTNLKNNGRLDIVNAMSNKKGTITLINDYKYSILEPSVDIIAMSIPIFDKNGNIIAISNIDIEPDFLTEILNDTEAEHKHIHNLSIVSSNGTYYANLLHKDLVGSPLADNKRYTSENFKLIKDNNNDDRYNTYKTMELINKDTTKNNYIVSTIPIKQNNFDEHLYLIVTILDSNVRIDTSRMCVNFALYFVAMIIMMNTVQIVVIISVWNITKNRTHFKLEKMNL